MSKADAADLDAVVAVAEFRSALRVFQRRTELAARRSGLTPQRYLLLLMIKGAPDRSERATLSDLMHRLQLAQSSATELVDRAEEAGLVERERSGEDARVVHVRLTPDGERRLERCLTTLAVERQRLAEAIEETIAGKQG